MLWCANYVIISILQLKQVDMLTKLSYLQKLFNLINLEQITWNSKQRDFMILWIWVFCCRFFALSLSNWIINCITHWSLMLCPSIAKPPWSVDILGEWIQIWQCLSLKHGEQCSPSSGPFLLVLILAQLQGSSLHLLSTPNPQSSQSSS